MMFRGSATTCVWGQGVSGRGQLSKKSDKPIYCGSVHAGGLVAQRILFTKKSDFGCPRGERGIFWGPSGLPWGPLQDPFRPSGASLADCTYLCACAKYKLQACVNLFSVSSNRVKAKLCFDTISNHIIQLWVGLTARTGTFPRHCNISFVGPPRGNGRYVSCCQWTFQK